MFQNIVEIFQLANKLSSVPIRSIIDIKSLILNNSNNWIHNLFFVCLWEPLDFRILGFDILVLTYESLKSVVLVTTIPLIFKMLLLDF